MEYTIDTSKPFTLNWSAKGKERIIQNVFIAIYTWKYEVAYNREFGIIQTLMDKPLDTAEAIYTSEVFRVVNEYEPRADIKEVKFIGVDENGNMQFKVVIDI